MTTQQAQPEPEGQGQGWTREVPTEEGWYWFWARFAGVSLVEVAMRESRWGGIPELRVLPNLTPIHAVNEGYWQGPIQPPAPPQTEEEQDNDR